MKVPRHEGIGIPSFRLQPGLSQESEDKQNENPEPIKIIKNLTSAARAAILLFSPQITLAGVLALLVLPARADTFGSGTNIFTIDFVDIGNPGNGDDRGAGGGSYSEPYGGVPYIYRMGVTEAPQEWITKATKHLRRFYRTVLK